MLDPEFVRDHIESVRTGLRNRGLDPDKALEEIATLEGIRRRSIPEVEGLKRLQNTSGDEIARAKRQGHDTGPVQEANRARAQQIKQLEVRLDAIEHQRTQALLALPNLPHAERARRPKRRGQRRSAASRRAADVRFRTQAALGSRPALGIIDFERAHEIRGARFSVLSGAGARLSRALINFMLELHTREHRYREIEPPFLVNSATLTRHRPVCRSSRRTCSRSPETGISISSPRRKCR